MITQPNRQHDGSAWLELRRIGPGAYFFSPLPKHARPRAGRFPVEASVPPSGAKATEKASLTWPVRTAFSDLVAVSQSRIVPSSQEVAKVLPSGANWTQWRPGVSREGGDLGAGGDVPELDEPVVAGRREELAVGRERQSANLLRRAPGVSRRPCARGCRAGRPGPGGLPAARVLPSGAQASAMNPRAFTAIEPIAVALIGSQSRTTPGPQEVARVLPSGVKATRKTNRLPPPRTAVCLPLATSQSLTTGSLPEAAGGQGLTVGRIGAAVHPVGRDMEDGLLSVRGALEDLDHTTRRRWRAACRRVSRLQTSRPCSWTGSTIGAGQAVPNWWRWRGRPL